MKDILEQIKLHRSNFTSFIRQHYPDFYQKVNQLSGKSFSEKLYKFFYGEHFCPICGAHTKYINFFTGYKQYCSSKCAAASEKTKEKRKQTNLQRYGVEHVAQNIAVKQHVNELWCKKYGGHPLKNEKIRKKVKQTCLERYGVEWSGAAASRIDKVKKTNKKRYGVEWVFQSKNTQDKCSKTKFKKYGDCFYHNIKQSKITRNEHIRQKYGAIKYENKTLTMPCPHPDCKKCERGRYDISLVLYCGRRKHNCETCTTLFPIHSADYGVSNVSQMLFKELDKIFNNYTTYYHSKNKEYSIQRYRLDYYVEELKMCIEFNGDDWHANPNKYGPDDRPFPQYKKTAKDIWKHDSRRKKFLESMGITVIIIWASDYQSGRWKELINNYLKSIHIV